MTLRRIAAFPMLAVILCLCAQIAADEPVENRPAASDPGIETPAKPAAGPVPLNKEGTILLDARSKKLIVETEVVLREGMLEMLLCKKHTKEHESILAFPGQAYVLHAGLVAMGLDPGTPVRFTPEYKPPTGPKLKIEVVWTGEDGKERRADARKWVRHSIHRFFGEPLETLPAGVKLPEEGELRYDATNKELSWYGPMTAEQRDEYLALSEDEAYRKAIRSFFQRSQPRQMTAEWVFAGSAFAVDEIDGRKIYLAESGDVICVANFPSAMIDVSVPSSPEGRDNLMFEAWTERIPPLGTAVRLEITPAAKEPPGRDSERAGDSREPETRNGRNE